MQTFSQQCYWQSLSRSSLSVARCLFIFTMRFYWPAACRCANSQTFFLVWKRYLKDIRLAKNSTNCLVWSKQNVCVCVSLCVRVCAALPTSYMLTACLNPRTHLDLRSSEDVNERPGLCTEGTGMEFKVRGKKGEKKKQKTTMPPDRPGSLSLMLALTIHRFRHDPGQLCSGVRCISSCLNQD